MGRIKGPIKKRVYHYLSSYTHLLCQNDWTPEKDNNISLKKGPIILRIRSYTYTYGPQKIYYLH